MLELERSEVGVHDSTVAPRDSCRRLQLDDELLPDEEVEAVHADLPTSVPHWDAVLALEGHTAVLELDDKRLLVHRLQEPWAEGLMNLHGGADHSAGELRSLHLRGTHRRR